MTRNYESCHPQNGVDGGLKRFLVGGVLFAEKNKTIQYTSNTAHTAEQEWMVNRMADLLIKGLEMPSECEFCPMCEDIGGLGCRVNHLVILRRHGQARPSWCPLVEVPAHGRLVDADLLYDKWMWGSTDRTAETKCIELIDLSLAPTVLEASE